MSVGTLLILRRKPCRQALRSQAAFATWQILFTASRPHRFSPDLFCQALGPAKAASTVSRSRQRSHAPKIEPPANRYNEEGVLLVANVAELELKPRCADEPKGTIWPSAFGLRTWHTLSFNATPGAREREGNTAIRHFDSSRRVLPLALRSGNRNSGRCLLLPTSPRSRPSGRHD